MALFQSLAVLAATPRLRWASGKVKSGGNIYDITTGLATTINGGASFAESPTIDHTIITVTPIGVGKLRTKHFKPTSTSDPTPTSCGQGDPVTMTWWAVGT
jgi:hypothetical protein